MSQLVLDERNTSSRGTRSAGESRDWAANVYVQAKTRLNGVTEIGGIDAVGAVGVEGRGIEAADGFAAEADDVVAVQTVSNRSAWALLRRPLFRALWIASLTSSIGTWMHELGAAWLMTSLTLSPVMVALMQTAASLPIVLLALPAGAIADMVDRRRMLLFTQGWMLASATALGVLTVLGATTPWLLLILTFALGAGAAMNAPAWQATTSEAVPCAELPAAVVLTGLGLNLARAVGPAVGGVIVIATGAWAVFLLNAASFLGVIIVLSRWRRTIQPKQSPSRPVLNTIGEGIRYASQTPALRAVLVRTAVLVPFASALWALLPLLARYELELNCFGYGTLFGFLGVGSVIGAIFLPKLQSHFSTDTLVAAATIMFAAAIAALAEVRHFGLLCLILMVAGMAWITLMTSFNVATQKAVPSWIRARALSLYLLIFHGGMAAGSVLWGAVTQHAGVAVALFGAAGGLLVSLVAMAWYPFEESKQSDSTSSTYLDRAPNALPVSASKLLA
ncbi:MAG TPA: MFS transporter [Pyrinomonadaceae bacterium]|nr:MFS transporter [Pyrinomonadaceae bacterium]